MTSQRRENQNVVDVCHWYSYHVVTSCVHQLNRQRENGICVFILIKSGNTIQNIFFGDSSGIDKYNSDVSKITKNSIWHDLCLRFRLQSQLSNRIPSSCTWNVVRKSFRLAENTSTPLTSTSLGFQALSCGTFQRIWLVLFIH